MIIKEDAYVALPTVDGEIVFAISVKDNEPHNPHLVYASGDHALLYRSDKLEDIVLLDYVNKEAQKYLNTLEQITIAEIDYKEKRLVREYSVPIEIKAQLDRDIKKFL